MSTGNLQELDSSLLLEQLQSLAYERHAYETSPSVLYRPTVKRDGDEWCALLGDNIQVGVSGFGMSPEEACRAFDAAWRSKG